MRKRRYHHHHHHYQLLATFILATLGLRSRTSTLCDAAEVGTSSITDDVERLDVSVMISCARKNCSYTGLKLGNELRVTLISAPALQKSAAAMVLRVGALNDFEELPGVANLVGETVTRLGSGTFPQNEFVRLLRANNGKLVGPETSGDRQLFGFEVNAGSLRPTLERFAQLFVQPQILSDDVTKSTLAEIVEEVTKRTASTAVDNDIRKRIRLAERALGDQSHAFSHSIVGDSIPFYRLLIEGDGSDQLALPWGKAQTKSQRTELHDKLRDFFTKWYSSNLMCLAVVGNENLDDLEQTVVSLFKNLKNRNAEKLSFSSEQHPWLNHLKRKIYSDNEPARIVRLVFPTPDILHKYRTAPESYAIALMNHEGSGSLYSVLKTRKLCKRVKATYRVEAGIAFFALTCHVHKSNVDIREDDIAELVFQYINLMREKGVQEWILVENERLDAIECSAARYDQQFSPLEYVQNIASVMHDFPMKGLSFEFANDERNLSFVEQFFTHLVPENMNILIFDQQNESKKKMIPSKPHYTFESISDELIQKWKTTEPSSDFSLPTPNQFIPENVNIYALETDESTDLRTIRETPKSQIWFKQDDRNPELSIKFNVFSSITRMNPANVTLSCILSRLSNYMLKEYEHSARRAGYDLSIVSKDNFLHIHLSGLTEKIPTCLKTITYRLARNQFADDQLELKQQFEKAKSKCTKKMQTITNDIPSLVNQYLKHLLLIGTVDDWSLGEIVNASERLRYKHVMKYLSEMHLRVHIRGLIYGNCTKKMALEIADIIERTFKSSRTIFPQVLLPHMVTIEEGKHFVSNLFSTSREDVYHYYSYYQFGVETFQNRVISSLLQRMIENKCAKTLTDTGVSSPAIRASIFQIQNIIGLLLSTKSAHRRPKHPTSMNFDIEKCLTDVHVMLEDMPDIVFEAYKKVWSSQHSRTEDSVDERYWKEISISSHEFDRTARLIEQMKSLQRTDVLAFFREMLGEHSSLRRKLSVQVFPRMFEPAYLDGIPAGAIKIGDVTAFKTSSSTLTLPSPFI